MDDVTPERWAWVPDYEGLYRVSDRGCVWSMPRATTRGGPLKQTPNGLGYIFLTLTKNGKQRLHPVHRLVLAAFAGPCPEGQEARHLDGDASNNRWAPGNEAETMAAGGNLMWGTHTENIADKRRHGTVWQLNVTHCPQGHEYTEENTLVHNGRRICLICKRERALGQYCKRRDAGLIPAYSEQSPEKLARTRELARVRQQRYQQRKRQRSEQVEGLW
jgi:hypothetical protein